MTAAKAAPPSGQSSKAGTRRRCAVEEMGRNSVIPWTRPRTMAWRIVKVRAVYKIKGPWEGPFELPRASAAGRSPPALTRLPRPKPVDLSAVHGNSFAGAGADLQGAGCVDTVGYAIDTPAW